MSSVNKAILIGNVGSVDVRQVGDGQVANLSLATSERYKDKNGQQQDKTEWHRLVVWGKLADVVAKYVQKGSKLYVEGKLETRKWADKDGVEKYTTEIRVLNMTMLDSRKDGAPKAQEAVSEECPF